MQMNELNIRECAAIAAASSSPRPIRFRGICIFTNDPTGVPVSVRCKFDKINAVINGGPEMTPGVKPLKKSTARDRC